MVAARPRSFRPVILVVDDDDVTRKVMEIILKNQGFRVFLASTSEEALRICGRFGCRIDLMIVEVRMPQMSGFELAELTARTRPEIPVLLMSGSPIEEDSAILARRRPGSIFLAKPFTHSMLLSKLHSLIAAHGRVSMRSSYGVN
jgi:two-component system OmpR family response regulator